MKKSKISISKIKTTTKPEKVRGYPFLFELKMRVNQTRNKINHSKITKSIYMQNQEFNTQLVKKVNLGNFF